MIHVVIRGNRFEAARAAADRKIGLAFDRELRPNETTGRVGDHNHAALLAWFSEPGEAPFPVGTLLFFNPAKLSGPQWRR